MENPRDMWELVALLWALIEGLNWCLKELHLYSCCLVYVQARRNQMLHLIFISNTANRATFYGH